MNINDKLTDEELEELVDGSTDIQLIRQCINLTQNNNQIDEESFADIFAHAISGFITEEEGTTDWNTANDNNWEWGLNIAESINEVITNKFTK